jgi:hypothetical protein
MSIIMQPDDITKAKIELLMLKNRRGITKSK